MNLRPNETSAAGEAVHAAAAAAATIAIAIAIAAHPGAGASPPPATATVATTAPAAFRTRLRFTGRGSEYFRLWIVHTLLSLLTLGLYAPWAKVRKARWFAQHTLLLGDRFDFHGQPWRILRGRALALLLLLAWSWAFEIHLGLGLAVLALACVAGPPLFAAAQRFRMVNTSWRGLRFGYRVAPETAYAVCVPLLLLVSITSLASALEASTAWIIGATVAAALGWPWAHARLKAMQHSHTTLGEQRFHFKPAVGEFYAIYVVAAGLTLLVGLAVLLVATLISVTIKSAGQAPPSMADTLLPAVLTTLSTVIVFWLAAYPYFAARMQQLVWRQTQWRELQFTGHMRFKTLLRLVLVQTLFTVHSAGLYWPRGVCALSGALDSARIPQALGRVERGRDPPCGGRGR